MERKLAPVTYRGLTAEEVAKVEQALRLIEESQTLINRVSQQLCPVNHFGDEWSESHKVYDEIKAYWYSVKGRLDSRREVPHA